MDVPQLSRDLADYMAQQLRLRGGRLVDVAGRAGRKLPRHVHEAVAEVIEAEEMARHPKMARLVDTRRVQRAEKRVRKFLDTQSPSAERKAEILDRLAAVAFVLFTAALAVFFWMVWRGYFD